MNVLLSDLFFNMAHDERRRLHEKRAHTNMGDPVHPVTEEEEREALKVEAEWFAATMRALTNADYTPDEYINDFLARL